MITVLARAVAARGRPAFMRSDNGSEFIRHALCAWLYAQPIGTHPIDPGAPGQDLSGESFRRKHYNTQRPHS